MLRPCLGYNTHNCIFIRETTSVFILSKGVFGQVINLTFDFDNHSSVPSRLSMHFWFLGLTLQIYSKLYKIQGLWKLHHHAFQTWFGFKRITAKLRKHSFLSWLFKYPKDNERIMVPNWFLVIFYASPFLAPPLLQNLYRHFYTPWEIGLKFAGQVSSSFGHKKGSEIWFLFSKKLFSTSWIIYCVFKFRLYFYMSKSFVSSEILSSSA